MWNLPGCFRLPAKACRPQPRLRLLDRLFTVQGSVSNHEQGRVNLLPFPKNVPPDSSSTLAPNGRFLKQNFWKFSGYGGHCRWKGPRAARLSEKERFPRRMAVFPRPGRETNKNPALAVCNHACELSQHAGRQDCFRRPVKVSAAIPACVPNRLFPVQCHGSKSRTGQGKFCCHFPKNSAFLCTIIRAKVPGWRQI
jgi:hypothetical protein